MVVHDAAAEQKKNARYFAATRVSWLLPPSLDGYGATSWGKEIRGQRSRLRQGYGAASRGQRSPGKRETRIAIMPEVEIRFSVVADQAAEEEQSFCASYQLLVLG